MSADKNSVLARIVPAALIAAIGVAGVADIWRPLCLYGHSALMDGFRQLVYDAAVHRGDWYPRWVPEFYYGHGSPIFHFYGPMPYAVTNLWVRLGLPIGAALKTTLVLSLVASGWFFYLFARLSASRTAAAAGAVFYMFAPYHLVDMLVRHAFGEHVAFAWIPLAAFGIVGCVRRPSATRAIAGALGVAGLALTHNVIAFIAMPFLAFLWAVEFFRTKSVRNAAAGAGATLAGLALSAFFWLPAFIEKEDVFAKESLTEEFFRYVDHFVYLKQLLLPTWGFGGSGVGWADDAMSFQIGLAHWAWIAAALAALAALARKKTVPDSSAAARRDVIPAFMVFAGGTFMAMFASQPVWDHIPPLAFVQFPWRFLVVAAFGASLVAAYAVDLVADAFAGGARASVAIAAALCAIVAYYPYARPEFAIYFLHGGYPVAGRYSEMMDRLTTPDSYVHCEDVLTIARVIGSGETGTSRDDYLPRTVHEKPDRPEKAPFAVEGGAIESFSIAGANRYDATVDMDADGTFELKQFFFAGWEATLDGAPAAVSPSAPEGLIDLRVPPGRHAIEIRFDSTPLRRDASYASIAAALALAGLGVAGIVPAIRR
jgi:hypothetical protein